MGSLFSSCFKHSQELNKSNEEENNIELQEQQKYKRKTDKNTKQRNSNKKSIDTSSVEVKQNKSSTSFKETQLNNSSNPNPNNELSKNTQSLPVEVQNIPEAQFQADPPNNIPTRQYDYNCEFIFDVKAVCCSVYLQCRTS